MVPHALQLSLQDQGHCHGLLMQRSISEDVFIQLSRLCSDDLHGPVDTEPILVELKLRAKRTHRLLLQLLRILNSSHTVYCLQRSLWGRRWIL